MLPEVDGLVQMSSPPLAVLVVEEPRCSDVLVTHAESFLVCCTAHRHITLGIPGITMEVHVPCKSMPPLGGAGSDHWQHRKSNLRRAEEGG